LNPACLIAHVIDEFTWGQTLFRLGGGRAPIPRTTLTAGALARPGIGRDP